MSTISKSFYKHICTTLTNRNIAIDNLDEQELRSLYSKLCSERTKNAYDKWLKSNLSLDQSFSDRGKKGLINRGKKMFGEKLSDDEAFHKAKTSLGGSHHGEKIKDGLYKKHVTKEAISESYRVRNKKKISSVLGISIENLTTDIIRNYYRSIGFYNQNPFLWKKKQAEKFVNRDLRDSEVEIMYSNYLSDRFSRSMLENVNNGYLNSKKGWYEFSSHENKQFYRSSWELLVYEALDEAYALGNVCNIQTPQRIKYEFEGKVKHYYPDIEYSTLDKTIVCEIKPLIFTKDPKNIAKFNAAMKIENIKFVVITENELFNIKEWCLNV